MGVAGTTAACLSFHHSLSPCRSTATQVRGFNVRTWMRDHRKKLPALVESLGKLVAAGKLQAAYTE